MALRTCSTCNQTKDETEFNYRNKLLGRRWGTCKECQSKQRADWYQRNKETHKANAYENKKRAIAQAQQYIWNYLATHPVLTAAIVIRWCLNLITQQERKWLQVIWHGRDIQLQQSRPKLVNVLSVVQIATEVKLTKKEDGLGVKRLAGRLGQLTSALLSHVGGNSQTVSLTCAYRHRQPNQYSILKNFKISI